MPVFYWLFDGENYEVNVTVNAQDYIVHPLDCEKRLTTCAFYYVDLDDAPLNHMTLNNRSAADALSIYNFKVSTENLTKAHLNVSLGCDHDTGTRYYSKPI